MTALFLSLGGVSYGLATGAIDGREIKNNTIRTADVRNGGLLGKDFRADGVGGGAVKESTLGTVPSAFIAHGSQRFAVVNAGGQLIRGRNASAARTAEGRYQVIFETDVRGCAYHATIGGPTATPPPPSGQITVSSLASNVNGVDIRTNDGDDPSPGAAVNRPFHLLVLC